MLFTLWIVVVNERRRTSSELVMNCGPDSSHFSGTTRSLSVQIRRSNEPKLEIKSLKYIIFFQSRRTVLVSLTFWTTHSIRKDSLAWSVMTSQLLFLHRKLLYYRKYCTPFALSYETSSLLFFFLKRKPLSAESMESITQDSIKATWRKANIWALWLM